MQQRFVFGNVFNGLHYCHLEVPWFFLKLKGNLAVQYKLQPSWRDKDEILTITMQYRLTEKKTRSTAAILIDPYWKWHWMAHGIIWQQTKLLQIYKKKYNATCIYSTVHCHTRQTKRLTKISNDKLKYN